LRNPMSEIEDVTDRITAYRTILIDHLTHLVANRVFVGEQCRRIEVALQRAT
jgi:hypothetical protein